MVEFVGELPKTPARKVNRKILREPTPSPPGAPGGREGRVRGSAQREAMTALCRGAGEPRRPLISGARRRRTAWGNALVN